MTYEMEYLMRVYACGAEGTKLSPPEHTVDWEKLVKLAVEQSITYTVAMAIKKNDVGCPEDIRSRLTMSLLGASLINQSKTEAVIALLSKFEKAGINAVLIKGIDAARHYANPECRASADTDILIGADDEAAALELLKKEGCDIIPRKKDSHHGVCIHGVIGMIELHVDLWEDIFDDVLFGSVGVDDLSTAPHRLISTESGSYYALGSNDALMFLTLHMIKHFVTDGMSLRMMMDTVLYYKYEKDNIDIEKYWDTLRALRFDKLMNTVFGAMIKYGGFCADDFPEIGTFSDENVITVLDDLEKGGWQGKNDAKNRRDGWLYLKRERLIKKKYFLKFFNYIWLDVFRDKLLALFPSADYMSQHYPKLRKHKWLYPFYWIHRLFTRGIKAYSSGKTVNKKNISDENKLSDTGQKRLEMFNKLEMI